MISHLNLSVFAAGPFITIPWKSLMPIQATAATLLTFWVIPEWMVKGEKGQRCCYCSTKAHGHIKSLSSGWAESKLANILRLSQHCPMMSDWLHTSNGVCTRLCIYVCVCPKERDKKTEGGWRFSVLSGDNEITHRCSRLWYNWECAVKDARERC